MNKKMMMVVFLIGSIGSVNAAENAKERIDESHKKDLSMDDQALKFKLFVLQIDMLIETAILKKQCEDDYTSRPLARFFPKPQVCLDYEFMQKDYEKLVKLKKQYMDASPHIILEEFHRVFPKRSLQSDVE